MLCDARTRFARESWVRCQIFVFVLNWQGRGEERLMLGSDLLVCLRIVPHPTSGLSILTAIMVGKEIGLGVEVR